MDFECKKNKVTFLLITQTLNLDQNLKKIHIRPVYIYESS